MKLSKQVDSLRRIIIVNIIIIYLGLISNVLLHQDQEPP